MAIEIHSSTPRSEKDGGGIVYDFYIDSAADKVNLPGPGGWAALTSTALDVSTFDIYALMSAGWRKL